MKIPGLFFSVFMAVTSLAQTPDLVLKSFVKKDTVLFRWAPANADLMLLGLKNGYTLERVNSSENFESGSSKESIFIAPFSERNAAYVNSENQTTRDFAEFITLLLSGSGSATETKNMSYFSLILGASVNRTLAEMLGIFTTDIPVSRSGFFYRVSINDSDKKSAPVAVNFNTEDTHADMSSLTGSARPKLKQAYLSWEAASLQKEYAAYWIERSTDSVSFSARNKNPYLFLKSQDEPNKVNCDFVDTNVVEGQVYYYRVTGINHFAEKGKSSNIVKVYVPKSIYGEVHIDSVSATGFDRKIAGVFVDYRQKNDITKFVLLRSDSLSYGYAFLAEQKFSGNMFSFSAKVPIESGDRYYYKVAAIGSDNDTVYSFPYYFFTLDQIPPSSPTGLEGVVNDAGIVTLTWNLNPENDIRGYRVYRSNSLKEEFIEVTKYFCETSLFHDTLRLDNLTSEIYYKISAVDLNYNNSKSCTPVKLLKPDTIPPVPAVFSNYEVTKGGVFLAWNNSSSADLQKSVLIRKTEASAVTVFSWSDTSSVFIDSTGVAGESYIYQIVCADMSENQSESDGLRVNFETGFRTGVQDIKATVNRELKQVELSWQMPQQEIYSIQIYRAKNDGNFVLYQTIREAGIRSYSDKNLSINNTYRYKIKVVYKSGVSSVLSDAVEVTY